MSVISKPVARMLTVSIHRRQEIIAEKHIHNTTYSESDGSTGSAQSISIDHKSTSVVPEEAHLQKVVPLARAVYEDMTLTMQRMSIMDKVVLVTG